MGWTTVLVLRLHTDEYGLPGSGRHIVVKAVCSFVYIEELEWDKPGAERLVWRSGCRMSSPAESGEMRGEGRGTKWLLRQSGGHSAADRGCGGRNHEGLPIGGGGHGVTYMLSGGAAPRLFLLGMFSWRPQEAVGCGIGVWNAWGKRRNKVTFRVLAVK